MIGRPLIPLLGSLIRRPGVHAELKEFGYLTYSKTELYEELLRDGRYIFTQQKTGTNYLCNVLAFYNSQLVGNPSFDFNEIYKFGIVRGVQRQAKKLRFALDFAAQNGHVYFQSHDFYDVPTKHVIVTSRNVLDFAVSSYHFHYVNFSQSLRTKKVDEVLGLMVSKYIQRHQQQRQAVRNAQTATLVNYDDLKRAPDQTFSRVVDEIYGNVDPHYLATAIEAASVESIKKYETKQPVHQMAAAAGKFRDKSLIRSGRIGEGSNFFSDRQKQSIIGALKKARIDPENPYCSGWLGH